MYTFSMHPLPPLHHVPPELMHLGLVHIVELVGYPGLFATIFAESGVFFGFFLPGSSMLFTAGILATKGVFSMWILIPLMAFASVLGDNAGYWFGASVGVSLFFKKDSRFFKHSHLERAKDFYERHGVLSVILARFVPIVRTFAPIVAGIVRMRYQTFLAYNVAGGILWSCGVTLAGYFLGRRVPLISNYVTPIIIAILLISCIPILWELRKPKIENGPVEQ